MNNASLSGKVLLGNAKDNPELISFIKRDGATTIEITLFIIMEESRVHSSEWKRGASLKRMMI